MLAGGGCPLRAVLGCGPLAWKEPTRHHQPFLSPLVGTLLKHPRLKKANLILEELLCRCFVASCLLPCSGENTLTSFASSSGLGPGICHLVSHTTLRLSPRRGPRLLIYQGRALAYAFTMQQQGQLLGCQLPSLQAERIPEAAVWGADWIFSRS